MYYVYFIGNDRPTLCVGVTRDLIKRIYEHKMHVVEGFTKRYRLTKLLHFEEFRNIEDAIQREKQLKHWNREWKLKLIKERNPELKDLYGMILE